MNATPVQWVATGAKTADQWTTTLGFIGATIVAVLALGAGIVYVRAALLERRSSRSRQIDLRARVKTILVGSSQSIDQGTPTASSADAQRCLPTRILVSGRTIGTSHGRHFAPGAPTRTQ
jgi:hypothetical protein